MAVEIFGADRSDPGPRGVIARFLEASAAQDVEGARSLLTEDSREGFELPGDLDEATVHVGDVVAEDDHWVVPAALEDREGPNELPFVVREEDGELRIDFDATVGKIMGVSPEDLMEQMAESLGAAMSGFGDDGEGAADEAGEAAADDLSAVTAPEVPECEAVEWHLPRASTEDFHDKIVDTARSLGSMFLPAFIPFPDLLDAEEWAPEGSKVVTSRYGNETIGFKCVDTMTTMEGYVSHIVDVTAYGMTEGQSLRLVWSRSASGDDEALETAHIQATAPETTRRFIGNRLSFDFGWKDPAAGDGDDW